jgi:hypothetical protein
VGVDELNGYSRRRIAIHRQHRRLLAALDCLIEAKIIPKSEYKSRKKRIAAELERAQAKLKASRPKSAPSVGRPPNQIIVKCRKPGCDKPAVNGYCSAEHAPLAFYGLPQPGEGDE